MSPEARQYLKIRMMRCLLQNTDGLSLMSLLAIPYIRMRCLLENTLSLIAVPYDQVEVLIGEYRHALLNVTPSSLAPSIRKI